MIKQNKDVTRFGDASNISIRVLHAWIGGPIPGAHREEIVGRLTELFEISAPHVVEDYFASCAEDDGGPVEFEIDFRARHMKADGGSIDRFVDFMVAAGIEFELGITLFGSHQVVTFRREFPLLQWETTEYQVPVVRVEEIRTVLRESVGKTKYAVIDEISRLLPPELPDLKTPAFE